MSDRYRFCPWCASALAQREEAGLVRKVCEAEGCGYIFYNNPLPVVAALVEHEGSILLARGKNWPPRMYGLITGFLERGEDPARGALRELEEELGLQGEVVGLIGVYPFEQRNEVLIAFHVVARGEIKMSDELEEVKRVEPARLKPWPFGTGLAVADWVARRSA